MPDNPEDQLKAPSYYRNYKDAHIIILREVEGTNASFTISVYSALCWIANDQEDQLCPFSVAIGFIAYRAGLSKRKTSDVLKILNSINLLRIDSGRGRKAYNTYTLLTPTEQVRERSFPPPIPIPESYDEFMDIAAEMDIDDEGRSTDSFWELQENNNWKRKDPSTGKWEPLYDWRKALIKFDERVMADLENARNRTTIKATKQAERAEIEKQNIATLDAIMADIIEDLNTKTIKKTHLDTIAGDSLADLIGCLVDGVRGIHLETQTIKKTHLVALAAIIADIREDSKTGTIKKTNLTTLAAIIADIIKDLETNTIKKSNQRFIDMIADILDDDLKNYARCATFHS